MTSKFSKLAIDVKTTFVHDERIAQILRVFGSPILRMYACRYSSSFHDGKLHGTIATDLKTANGHAVVISVNLDLNAILEKETMPFSKLLACVLPHPWFNSNGYSTAYLRLLSENSQTAEKVQCDAEIYHKYVDALIRDAYAQFRLAKNLIRAVTNAANISRAFRHDYEVCREYLTVDIVRVVSPKLADAYEYLCETGAEKNIMTEMWKRILRQDDAVFETNAFWDKSIYC